MPTGACSSTAACSSKRARTVATAVASSAVATGVTTKVAPAPAGSGRACTSTASNWSPATISVRHVRSVPKPLRGVAGTDAGNRSASGLPSRGLPASVVMASFAAQMMPSASHAHAGAAINANASATKAGLLPTRSIPFSRARGHRHALRHGLPGMNHSLQ